MCFEDHRALERQTWNEFDAYLVEKWIGNGVNNVDERALVGYFT